MIEGDGFMPTPRGYFAKNDNSKTSTAKDDWTGAAHILNAAATSLSTSKPEDVIKSLQVWVANKKADKNFTVEAAGYVEKVIEDLGVAKKEFTLASQPQVMKMVINEYLTAAQQNAGLTTNAFFTSDKLYPMKTEFDKFKANAIAAEAMVMLGIKSKDTADKFADYLSDDGASYSVQKIVIAAMLASKNKLNEVTLTKDEQALYDKAMADLVQHEVSLTSEQKLQFKETLHALATDREKGIFVNSLHAVDRWFAGGKNYAARYIELMHYAVVNFNADEKAEYLNTMNSQIASIWESKIGATFRAKVLGSKLKYGDEKYSAEEQILLSTLFVWAMSEAAISNIGQDKIDKKLAKKTAKEGTETSESQMMQQLSLQTSTMYAVSTIGTSTGKFWDKVGTLAAVVVGIPFAQSAADAIVLLGEEAIKAIFESDKVGRIERKVNRYLSELEINEPQEVIAFCRILGSHGDQEFDPLPAALTFFKGLQEFKNNRTSKMAERNDDYTELMGEIFSTALLERQAKAHPRRMMTNILDAAGDMDLDKFQKLAEKYYEIAHSTRETGRTFKHHSDVQMFKQALEAVK